MPKENLKFVAGAVSLAAVLFSLIKKSSLKASIPALTALCICISHIYDGSKKKRGILDYTTCFIGPAIIASMDKSCSSFFKAHLQDCLKSLWIEKLSLAFVRGYVSASMTEIVFSYFSGSKFNGQRYGKLLAKQLAMQSLGIFMSGQNKHLCHIVSFFGSSFFAEFFALALARYEDPAQKENESFASKFKKSLLYNDNDQYKPLAKFAVVNTLQMGIAIWLKPMIKELLVSSNIITNPELLIFVSELIQSILYQEIFQAFNPQRKNERTFASETLKWTSNVFNYTANLINPTYQFVKDIKAVSKTMSVINYAASCIPI